MDMMKWKQEVFAWPLLFSFGAHDDVMFFAVYCNGHRDA